MKRVGRIYSSCVLILAIYTCGTLNASASSEMQRAVILTTMTESALASVSLIQKRLGGKLQGFSWSATYSDRDLVFSGSGIIGEQKVSFTSSGYLWGEEKQNLLFSYSGIGYAGKDPLRINGKSDWPFDVKSSDYLTMDFQQAIKLGDNSFWGWVVGSEIIVGGVIGAGGAIATSAVATGGVALGAAIWIGAAGGATVATAFVSASETVKNLTESHEPVAPPPKPDRFKVPTEPGVLKPADGLIYTAISKEGKIQGSGPEQNLVLYGTYDAKNGKASGYVKEQ